jgi:hypothetical protein
LIAAVLALATGLGACATAERVDAAHDVHSFLMAVRDNDGPSFNRYVDRRAISVSLEGRLVQEARRSDMPRELRLAGAALAGPAAEVVTDTLVRPSVFRLIAYNLGYTRDQPIPKTLNIASGLRYMDEGRVCAAKSKSAPCLLTFEREGDVWRLVSIDAPLRDLQL